MYARIEFIEITFDFILGSSNGNRNTRIKFILNHIERRRTRITVANDR